MDLRLLIKGAPDGHEFYGNQWVGGGGATTLSVADRTAVMEGEKNNTDENWAAENKRAGAALSQKSQEAIAAFTSSYGGIEHPCSYRVVNGVLRSGETSVGVRSLDKAFTETPGLAKPVTVYRGGFLSREQSKSLLSGVGSKEGVYLNDPAFKSTSSRSEIAHEFATGKWQGKLKDYKKGESVRLIVRAVLPAGTKAIAVQGENKREREYLLDRKAALKVVAITKKGPDLYTVHAVAVKGVGKTKGKKPTRKIFLADLLTKAKKSEEDFLAYWVSPFSVEVSSANKVQLTSLIKGAPDGHEFYGNQHTGGGGRK